MREAHRTAESKDPYPPRKPDEIPPAKTPDSHDFWAPRSGMHDCG